MSSKYITVTGAREHNLKNINVKLPRDRLVVLTGLSGSGKSSLAFDTIYAEGQRRYVESLSSYARMFLGQMAYVRQHKIGKRFACMLPYLLRYARGLSPKYFVNKRVK